MSEEYIRQYYLELARLRNLSGSGNESVVREAFQNCLQQYCKQYDRALIQEMRFGAGKYPDATMVDALRLPWGYWEAKDAADDLDLEVANKFAAGYPQSNILFTNDVDAILIQEGELVQKIRMADAAALDKLLRAFFEFKPAEIGDFHNAMAKFKTDLPTLIQQLTAAIHDAQDNNAKFKVAADEFLQLCRHSINPEVTPQHVVEMLIQHILTAKIFVRVFDEDEFHSDNNIARQLDSLAQTFFRGELKRNFNRATQAYYGAITGAAAHIANHREKQKFLKLIYQDFYKIYNPDAADTLGVIYTPDEIVNFMLRATDAVLTKHFQRKLNNKQVHILDPATGTGTFIADLIDYLPVGDLKYKFENEIYANEVGILPYYIANLNIEYTYQQKMGGYVAFPNICFVDTLDNVHHKNGKGQVDMIAGISFENLQRVRRQNSKDISVIIGNPPYNAQQKNVNDNNPNRKYPVIDARIKETYVKWSNAKRTVQYDMYKRFMRWASDRLDGNGVMAFITNRAWIDSINDDGFRKIAFDEFNEIYIIDLGGDIRASYGRRGRPPGNVFGIQAGVAVGLFAQRKDADGCNIHYYAVNDAQSGEDKLAWLSAANFADIPFESIVPDARNNWLHQTDNDFHTLLPVASEQTKMDKNGCKNDAIFKLYSLGVFTKRDAWAFDFDKTNLRKKVRFFAKTYNAFLENDNQTFDTVIKWSHGLRDKFNGGQRIKIDGHSFITAIYRPFVIKFYCANNMVSDNLLKSHRIFFGEKFNRKNKVICFSGRGHNKFSAIAFNRLTEAGCLSGGAQMLPLYRYEDGERVCNITGFGLAQFRAHYQNKNISAEDVFHYTYAVLHNPAYREKYALDLRQEFPRLPFYSDFARWVAWGEELMNLHIDFHNATPYPFKRVDKSYAAGRAKLRITDAKIVLDEQTELRDLPVDALAYEINGRSALAWVLDQYREKKIKDPTIAAKFNAYRFADYKEAVIDLLARVCTVSTRTIAIVQKMQAAQPPED